VSRRDGDAGDGAPLPSLLGRDALASWTHDLRNPLAALVANLHHLRETLAPSLDDESEEVFAECLALFGLLERYTANLEILAQADVPVAERGSAVDLVELANEVATRLGPYANVTGHRLRVLVQGAILPRVETDRLVLRRVLENVAANALENAPSGPVDLVVGVRDDAAGEGFVAVIDQGPPWPPAVEGTTTSWRRAPGSRYGRGLGLDAAKLAAKVVGAKLELGSTARGEASATIAAPAAREQT
jgi:signal transduction histidine kinase